MLKNGGSKLAGRIALITAAISVACMVITGIVGVGSGTVITDVSSWIGGVLAFAAPAAVIWWGITYRETSRKPGATPLIVAVIAIPVCVVVRWSAQFYESAFATIIVGVYAVLFGLAAVVLLIVGVVKKLAA